LLKPKSGTTLAIICHAADGVSCDPGGLLAADEYEKIHVHSDL